MPDRLPILHLYKLSPLPHGADEASITCWARSQGWRLRVLKSLGPQNWLVGSQDEAPQGWLAFNGSTILVLPVSRRSHGPQAVSAGHGALSIAPPPPPKPRSQPSPKHDALQVDDPWQEYLASRPALSGAVTKAPVSSAPPDQLQQHDRRLRALESTLADVKASQAAQQAQQATDRQSAARDLQLLASQFQSSLESLQRSQQAQQDQIRQGMDELKTLFLATRSAQEPSKKPRKGQGPDSADQMDAASAL